MTSPFIVTNGKPDLLRAALTYARAGKPVFPCDKNSKSPLISSGHLKATTDEPQITTWWHRWPNASIGMPTGPASGIYVIDIDMPDGSASFAALESSNEPLPLTRRQITGSGGLHLMFQYPMNGVDFRNTAGKLGKNIDTRGNGGYIILPPSGHESGKFYQFEDLEVPLAPMPEWLCEILTKPKHEAPPAQGPPLALPDNTELTKYGQTAYDGLMREISSAEKGTRNDTLNRVAFRVGQLVAGGEMSESLVEQFISAAINSGLAEPEARKTFSSGFKRGQDAPATSSVAKLRLVEGGKSSSARRTKPDEAPSSRSHTLPPAQAAPDTTPSKPEIFLQQGNRPNYLDAARLVLKQSGGMYQRGGAMVSVVRYVNHRQAAAAKNEMVRIELVTPDSVAEQIERDAFIVKFDKRSAEWVPANFPRADAAAIVSTPERWIWPYLQGLIMAPTMRADGSIIQQDGYDDATGLFLETGGVNFGIKEIPSRPTISDAQHALFILDELIGQFPFVGLDSEGRCPSKSVALAAILTALVRQSLPSAPMFCFSAPTAGSGKSKLADIVAAIVTGKPASIITYTPDEGEFEKRGGALLLQGYAVNCLDNINGTLKSNWLCQALTQQEVTFRILGRTENVTTPTRCTWIATGNNIEPQEDLVRRLLYCRIDPETDRPDERRFDFEPVARCLAARPRYVRAALTILKAYHVAGKPKQDIEPYGSFEVWSDEIRSALIWAGEPDPMIERKALEAGDSSVQSFAALLSAWWDVLWLKRCTAGEVTDKAHSNEQLREALLQACGNARDEITSRSLGRYLKRYVGRVVRCEIAEGDERMFRLLSVAGRGRMVAYYIEELRQE